MKQASDILTVQTPGQGFTDITRDVSRFVSTSGISEGLVTLFIRHTSASLIIQENADPDVLKDLRDGLDRLAPRDGGWRHSAEGPDDMPAHIRAALTHVSVQIPVLDGRLALGTWQGIYVAEHRDRPHRRQVVAHLLGE